MVNQVEFPGLGISLEVNRVAFTVFGIPIYWYGVLIGVGMLLAVVLAFRLAPRYGIDVDRMIDVIIIGFVCAIVCGRLYYVLFVDMQYRTFLELINLRLGGIAIYGGIIGAFAGAALGCKLRKVPMLPLFDIVGMGFLLGQAIGRWGNFFNQEAFGDSTLSVFGMISPATVSYLQNNQAALVAKGILADPYMPVHPTFLYESVWCFLGFFLLLWYQKRRHFHGEVFLLYIIWYGAGRAVIEGLRTDPLMIGSMRVSQVVAVTSALVALVIWAVNRHKHRGQPLEIPEIPPHTATVKVDGPDGPATVTISWPAGGLTPNGGERQAMALAVLQAEKETPKTGADEPSGEEAAEITGVAEPEPEAEPEPKDDTEDEPEAEPEPKDDTEDEPEAEPEKDGKRSGDDD